MFLVGASSILWSTPSCEMNVKVSEKIPKNWSHLRNEHSSTFWHFVSVKMTTKLIKIRDSNSKILTKENRVSISGLNFIEKKNVIRLFLGFLDFVSVGRFTAQATLYSIDWSVNSNLYIQVSDWHNFQIFYNSVQKIKKLKSSNFLKISNIKTNCIFIIFYEM